MRKYTNGNVTVLASSLFEAKQKLRKKHGYKPGEIASKRFGTGWLVSDPEVRFSLN